MQNEELFATLNMHNVGVLMRAAVERAMDEIRFQRWKFLAEEKTVDYKSAIDFVSSADKKAQEIYLTFLKNNFPKFGVIAEEDDLFTDAQPFVDTTTNKRHYFFFTIDPLDGTKAFIRKQSDGFSSMLSLIHHCPELGICEVIAACIGDPMTHELFYTRPGSPRVHQLDQYLHEREVLSFNPKTKPKDTYVLLRDNPKGYSELAQKLSDGYRKNSFFKDFELQGGSIGLSFAKLWKGQYAGLMLKPGKTTVWDNSPLIGISKKLGFVPMVYDNERNRFLKTDFKIIATRDLMNQEETLVIHQSQVPKFRSWQDKYA